MGGPGLFTMSFIDSSPVVVPLGNDLLMLALSARYHQRMLYFALMATAGGLLGSFVTDWLSRKGERRLKKVVPGRYLEFINTQVEKRAGWTLAVSAIMPPPFPFTAILAAAAAFQYPRKKLFAYVGIARFIRFTIEGALAIHYGRWIIKQAESPLLEHIMLALIVVSIAGTAFSIFQWGEKAKQPARQPA
jgi:membrane protein YqaA with SNARE-associated domain